MNDPVPHFSTFGKNYTRRFKDTDLFEQIFSKILEDCYKWKFVDPTEIFVDATHVKARANNKKMRKRIAQEEALFYEELLKKEINEDRNAHGKKELKEKDSDDDDSNPGGGSGTKEIKTSTTDPDSGWFHKGEHKQVFAYSIETACDKNGWVVAYTVSPGNEHDSRTFKGLFDKIEDIGTKTIIADAGYKTPAIAKLLTDRGIKPLFPYKRPMTKEGFFKKYEYVYDEYYDCYICPNNQVLRYSTTNRDGYKEYKSCKHICEGCPYLSQCTEMCDLYKQRKETIERLFGTAKEHHGFRYTQMYGKARMEMKVGLTYACLNLKKLAKMLQRIGVIGGPINPFSLGFATA